jgi:phosphate:Na+ symporter
VSAVSRLDSALADAGGAIALEAAWRAELDIARNLIAIVERRLNGESVQYDSKFASITQIEHFLESLSLETTDLHSFGPRLVQLCHGLDHLIHLHEDMSWMPAPSDRWRPPPSFEAGAQSLGTWLEATNDPNTTPDRAIIQKVLAASQQVDAEYQTERTKLLESVAMQRMSAAEARKGLDSLAWASDALHHASHLIDSIQSASGGIGAAASSPKSSA